MTRDRGAVSVVAVVVAVGLTVLALVLVQAASLVGVRHTAAAAADLAALAAARAASDGEDGCAAADRIADRNGAELAACRMDHAVSTVTVRVVSDPWWGWRWSAEQRARAAPVSYLSGS
ncbi:TadE-like protein [Aeromicrobium marinum DSM 15272]|uniref:TadE-like protein n=1 Tax=Aeromicrobium marinum DSM 15272 TaxID=585531 RepID=E2SFI6_9ACTN|nr:Rv3654c family TadE-like protein [Aeromicrobium marinum]EFQ82087.1 TadE-like protein [Aeromicrobium marinum DSM 15272]